MDRERKREEGSEEWKGGREVREGGRKRGEERKNRREKGESRDYNYDYAYLTFPRVMSIRKVEIESTKALL